MRVNPAVPGDPDRRQHVADDATSADDPTDGRDPTAPRDLGLDLLRGAALLRVVLWHATGAAAVTLVAAIPVMFFVSGQLFAGSAERRGGWRTVHDRLRRIGPPLWLFALVAWGAMFVGSLATGTGLAWSRMIWWIVPLTDPVGSSWEGGWLATPLWYLRTLFWVLLLAPVLLRALRRSAAVVIGLGVAAVLALEWAHRRSAVAARLRPERAVAARRRRPLRRVLRRRRGGPHPPAHHPPAPPGGRGRRPRARRRGRLGRAPTARRGREQLPRPAPARGWRVAGAGGGRPTTAGPPGGHPDRAPRRDRPGPTIAHDLPVAHHGDRRRAVAPGPRRPGRGRSGRGHLRRARRARNGSRRRQPPAGSRTSPPADHPGCGPEPATPVPP